MKPDRKGNRMNSSSTPRIKIWAMVAAIAAPILFVASLPWLQNLPDALIFLFTGIAATTTVVGSFVVAVFQDRKLDEWHRAAARFASQWGWLAGSGVVALLLALPPFHQLIMSVSGAAAGVATPDRTLVLLAFTFGFMTVVVAQMLCTVVLSFVWRARKSRAG
tara:strand:+ start:581 stop:1069 length:489 start_codon:yes stop_codon:yes gene_type:complete